MERWILRRKEVSESFWGRKLKFQKEREPRTEWNEWRKGSTQLTTQNLLLSIKHTHFNVSFSNSNGNCLWGNSARGWTVFTTLNQLIEIPLAILLYIHCLVIITEVFLTGGSCFQTAQRAAKLSSFVCRQAKTSHLHTHLKRDYWQSQHTYKQN